MSKLEVWIANDSLKIGNVSITFHRTLRIPDDGKQYMLPPSLGAFPLRRVEDFKDRVPSAWREHGGVFLPMYQREAMWLSFSGPHWRPNAIKVAVGKVNALSGETWSERLSKGRSGTEDYMVVPNQPWLDGINAGNGEIKQFVAMPLGMGYTVEGQVTGEEKFGGVQVCVFDPKAGKFPDQPPAGQRVLRGGYSGQMAAASSTLDIAGTTFSSGLHANSAKSLQASSIGQASLGDAAFQGQEMGLGAGGRMKQKIYPDPHGIETWDQDACGRVYVHLVNSQMWTLITGEKMPSTPVSAQAYANAGYPWFDLYDEDKQDVAPSEVFDDVKSVKQMDESKGFKSQQDDTSFEVSESEVVKYHPTESGVSVPDGKW